MKIFTSFIAMCLMAMPAMALTPAGQSRRSMSAQMVTSAPRATASTNQISDMANATAGVAVVDKSSVRVPVPDDFGDGNSGGGDDVTDDDNQNTDDDKLAEIERQKQACLNNNIGVGNTFVWASRYSNTTNYASMVEDVNNPENNVCFVLVNITSADPRIDVSDVPEKYFQMGQNITCGSWADADVLRQRILDAKRSGRTWATVGGAVGGAGVGVGMMELFGNRLIGGDVMGQRQYELSGDATQLLIVQLRALRNQDPERFNQYMDALETLQKECESWTGAGQPEVCSQYDFVRLQNARN